MCIELRLVTQDRILNTKKGFAPRDWFVLNSEHNETLNCLKKHLNFGGDF